MKIRFKKVRRKSGIIIPPTRPIDYNLKVISKETHHKSIKNTPYSTHEPEFNVLEVEAFGSDFPFKIIDPFFLCNEGEQPICHKAITSVTLDKFKGKSHKKWDDQFKANLLCMAVDKKDYFKDDDLNWRKTIDYLAYQGLGKDKVIVEILKSLAFPMPRALKYQSLNPHTLMFTQTKTAKTTTLTELGWQPLSGSTLTVPGLFGGGMKHEVGTAQGWGVLGIDECGKVNLSGEDQRGILEFCLEYLQKGTMQRIIYGSKVCNGTKTFCLFSNPESTRDSLMPYYIKNLLYRLGALSEQVSSRLGIMVFGNNFNQVWFESLYYRKDLDKLRLLIKEVWIEHQKKWMKVLDSYGNWLNRSDEDYIKRFKELPYNDDNIYRWVINGFGKFHNRSKCAAIKLTVMNNLDKFYLMKHKEYMKEVAYELSDNWEFIKNVNLSSVKLISDIQKIDRDGFWDLCDKEKVHLLSVSELSRCMDLPWSTLKDWISAYKNKYGSGNDWERENLRRIS